MKRPDKRRRHQRFMREWVQNRIYRPKTGDGCTMCPDWMIVGTEFVDFVEECCEPHDKRYAQGGVEFDREIADLLLADCFWCKLRKAKAWLRAHLWRALVYKGTRRFGASHFNYK